MSVFRISHSPEIEAMFDQTVDFYKEKYDALVSGPANFGLPPAAACVVLLCTVIEHAFLNGDDEEE